MLHLVADVDDKIQIGDQILIVFKKKSGRKSYVSIEAPKNMPIKFHKGTKDGSKYTTKTNSPD
jgi:sRNA-binding carbon storage regulator CsrA